MKWKSKKHSKNMQVNNSLKKKFRLREKILKAGRESDDTYNTGRMKVMKTELETEIKKQAQSLRMTSEAADMLVASVWNIYAKDAIVGTGNYTRGGKEIKVLLTCENNVYRYTLDYVINYRTGKLIRIGKEKKF